ncbi:MAG: hypothetical protein GF308_02050 [Candidatus Heimdallarchaeota archaeon]|nr:hypothetical protein [Candidatus Heimdallarchaeota archaeon]
MFHYLAIIKTEKPTNKKALNRFSLTTVATTTTTTTTTTKRSIVKYYLKRKVLPEALGSSRRSVNILLRGIPLASRRIGKFLIVKKWRIEVSGYLFLRRQTN